MSDLEKGMQEWSQEPWTRMPTENFGAFQIFCKYRDLRPTERGMAGLAKLTGKTTATLYSWSKKYRWEDRINAYVDYLDRCQRDTQEVMLKEMRDRQARQAMKLQQKGERALDDLDPSMLTPKDMVTFIKEGALLEEKARGASIEAIRIEHKGSVNLNHTQSQFTQEILNNEEASIKSIELLERLSFGEVNKYLEKKKDNGSEETADE